jgi:hypothetical protein
MTEDLFTHAARRMVYQQTSRDAFESIQGKPTGELDRLILRAIGSAGEDGITCQAIENKIARSHQAVSGNLRHLVERRLVRASGNFGKTDAGRRAIKWVIDPVGFQETESGRAAASAAMHEPA